MPLQLHIFSKLCVLSALLIPSSPFFFPHPHSLTSWISPLNKSNCPNFDTYWCLLPSHLIVLHLLVPPALQTHTYFHSLCIRWELYQYCSLFCHCWNFKVQIQPPYHPVLTHLTVQSCPSQMRVIQAHQHLSWPWRYTEQPWQPPASFPCSKVFISKHTTRIPDIF